LKHHLTVPEDAPPPEDIIAPRTISSIPSKVTVAKYSPMFMEFVMPLDHPTLQTLQQTPTSVQTVTIAIHRINVLRLDRRILPVHQVSRLVTANGHMMAKKTGNIPPKYYASHVTNDSCGYHSVMMMGRF